MPTVLRTGQWAVARRILTTGSVRARAAMDAATMQEAQYLRGKIVAGIREQAPGGQPFKPLAPSTLAIRRFKRFRGTKALIVRGDLRNSITAQRTGFASAFVGVLRTARAKDGRSLVNVAEVQEFGSRPIVVRITPKMRAFLNAALASLNAKGTRGRDKSGRFTKAKTIRYRGSGTGIAVIQIPARPFIRPTVDKYMKPADVRVRFLARVGRLLDGDFGQMGIAIPR